CSVIAIIVFIFLYWLTDLKGINRWARFLQPAGSNPLLTYIIPFIMWATYRVFNYYPLPDGLRTGATGVLYCILYAVVVVWIVKWLNRMHIRLQQYRLPTHHVEQAWARAQLIHDRLPEGKGAVGERLKVKFGLRALVWVKGHLATYRCNFIQAVLQ